VLRLPGIYGPDRSPLERVRAGLAHRVGLADQVFSRVHVDDIVAGLRLALGQGATGAFNLADDLPAPQDAVVEHAARLLGLAVPPIVTLDMLSPAARAFYRENRRVASGKARRLLGWRPAYSTYRDGLRALIASTSPATASRPPSAASADQR
jgi:nucleoside-diphosphate-sugar epimerase